MVEIALNDRVIAVTGGFGQLGLAIVRAALDAGARVVALDRTSVPVDCKELGNALALGELDLAESATAANAIDQAVAKLGRLDALINVAGAFRWETLEQGHLETWDLLYRTNLRTAVSVSRAALPHLLRNGGGRIVNVGANAATHKASAGMGAYTAAKAGIIKFTEALAEETKDRGITVNAVLPSIIDTPANRTAMPNADFQRWVAPRDIANVVLFLLADEARAVTGASIPVTGRV